jgi:hypothetical protein
MLGDEFNSYNQYNGCNPKYLKKSIDTTKFQVHNIIIIFNNNSNSNNFIL